MRVSLLTVDVRSEHDVVSARQRAREVAEMLDFGEQDRTRIATAVSEIARNAWQYADGGRVEYAVDGDVPHRHLVVEVTDRGPGIPNLPEILAGDYVSSTGMGLGLLGARRLMDRFAVDAAAGAGTRVVLGKQLPAASQSLPARELAARVERLVQQRPRTLFAELQLQNAELLRVLEAVKLREQELLQLNRELEDTNRGVVALYAELDERVEQLRRSNSLRAQFTSYLSHEFRTPLDSMLALSGLLLNRVDGELTEEQEKQVGYIRRSARDLLDMVDDLLDTARVESGLVTIRPERFHVADVFSALRATLRPLLISDSVALVFEEPDRGPELETDQAKVTQILRNFISNALKFTERGEVRVRCETLSDDRVRLSVRDTGIGLSEANRKWIFEDFTQVDGAVQRRVKGTGLGLPLSRKLARMLGGDVYVESAPGEGSLFSAVLPTTYRPPALAPDEAIPAGL